MYTHHIYIYIYVYVSEVRQRRRGEVPVWGGERGDVRAGPGAVLPHDLGPLVLLL